MRMLDLFAGIGGFSLAGHWMGWETVGFVEWDDFCQKVLKKNFPRIPIYGDIKKFKGERDSADIICGGFPCQPFSQAGKRKGTEDDRYLWPEMLRVIREVKPSFVVGENVVEIEKFSLDQVAVDLEGEGYTVELFDIPAYTVGGLHKRNRIWICGTKENTLNTNSNRKRFYKKKINGVAKGSKAKFRHNEISLPGSLVYESIQNGTDPRIFRVAHGVSDRMDRLKSLGNAIVPQVAYEIFKAIDVIKHKI